MRRPCIRPMQASCMPTRPGERSFGRPGIKAAQHHAGPVTDPNDDGRVSEEAVARLSAWVKERFPGADPEPQTTETCLYTNTADEHFIMDRRGPIVIGSACSGHGFKFASLV